MAATNKKILTFNVSDEIYNRVVTRFPKSDNSDKADTSEDTLLALLEAVENPPVASNDELESQCAELRAQNTELNAHYTELQAQYSSLSEQFAQTQASTEQSSELAQSELRALQDKYTELDNAYQTLHSTNKTLIEQIEDLQSSATSPNYISGSTDAFTSELLATITERLAERTNTPTLTPLQVLLDGFLKYNIQQYNLWFYDFVVSKKEILDLAHKHNPLIDSYKKLQKALGI